MAAEVEESWSRTPDRESGTEAKVYRARCRDVGCRIGQATDWATSWHHYQPHARNAADYHNENKHNLVMSQG